ncbi:NRAMP family divalent metal transporter [Amycolatopsis pithecellobii]|uniref:Divalent metal cation transporter n=1 Tax=Amycolatopsis pithecellobii TaxID=664692 RepID=A0A6N7YKF2_9PSEU|nr:divalent metal cation transporter [Amycolatopsis pithecellobii]MTD53367.1 hypothetical protein [Amycolatopsis pithecellobii]
MKKALTVTFGILTAIGGFVDIGDLVANAQSGARFGLRQLWIVVLGVIGICVFAEMAGRVAAVSHRPVFDLVRERLGPRMAMANLAGSYAVTLLTLTAEIGGVALTIQLASGLPHLLWVPLAAFAVWFVLWRVKFELMEQIFGFAGIALVVFVIAFFTLRPQWGTFAADLTRPRPTEGENWGTYGYLAVSLFASALTPYEVFFFSSGGVEEKWGPRDLVTARSNTFVGFPLGGLLGIAIMGCAATVFEPAGVQVEQLSQTALPVALALGKIGLVVVMIGFFAATFGAALETGLSTGYSVAQYFGWQWGKFVQPREAARFHTVVLLSILLGAALLLTTVDPVQITELSLVFSAVVLPLTYLPILVVANDRDYLGDNVNGRVANILGVVFLVIILVAALAALPLMIVTGMGES